MSKSLVSLMTETGTGTPYKVQRWRKAASESLKCKVRGSSTWQVAIQPHVSIGFRPRAAMCLGTVRYERCCSTRYLLGCSKGLAYLPGTRAIVPRWHRMEDGRGSVMYLPSRARRRWNSYYSEEKPEQSKKSVNDWKPIISPSSR